MSAKTMLIGLAGLDWGALRTRVAAGQLPGFAALIAGGTAGRMAPDGPVLAPMTWATIASGHLPDAHDVLLADEPWVGGVRPAGHAAWRKAPVWSRLEAAGRRTFGVGWPATSPGCAWPGLHVDPRVLAATGRDWDDWVFPRDAVPDRWRETLRALRVHPRDVTGGMLRPFVPGIDGIDQTRERRLIDIALPLARLSTAQGIAMALAEEAAWDAGFLFLDWLGAIREAFEDAAPPYDRVVDAAWAMLDALVAAIRRALPPETVLILAGAAAGSAGGCFIATGGTVRSGGTVAGLRARDIAPTLLACHGLVDPALGGRAWLGGTGGARRLPAGGDLPRAAAAEDAHGDLDRVRGFGHAPSPAPAFWHVERLQRLCQLLLMRDVALAGRDAEEALKLGGDAVAPLGVLAAVRLAADDPDALPPIADRIAAVAPGHLWEALVRAGFHAARGEVRLAAPLLHRIEAEGDATERLRGAACWLMLERRGDARRVFLGLLADDPDHIEALVGLGAATGLPPLDAEHHLRRALLLDPAHRTARAALVALLRETGRGREGDALEAGGAAAG